MLFVVGLCLIAVAIAMIIIARPGDGVSVWWLKNWAVGQSYALAVLTGFVLGICFVLSDLPV